MFKKKLFFVVCNKVLKKNAMTNKPRKKIGIKEAWAAIIKKIKSIINDDGFINITHI